MRVKAYRKRYGSAFPDIGEAMINCVMPLCVDLAHWHFGLTSDAPPRRVHPSETRWLEGLSKGQLENTLNQMAKTQRFGGLQDELETIFMKRIRISPALGALFNRMVDVQAKWLRATAPIFSARLPQGSPDKLILNQFATEWALAAGEEIKLRAYRCTDAKEQKTATLATERMRAALIKWTNAVLDSNWDQALKLIGIIEQHWMLYDTEDESVELPLFLEDDTERYAAGLHQAMKWVILGRWGKAFLVLHHSIFPEGEPEDFEAFITESESNPLFTHIGVALETIEQLCDLCEAPIIPEPLIAGDKVGGREWHLEELLGDGLWHGVDKSSMHGCIEEIFPLGEGEWANRTQTEALNLSTVNHPHIASIQDWGIDPTSNRWFIAYPYIYGESLIERIDQNGPLSEAQSRAFFLQVTEALLKGEKLDLLHRQIRPENIIFYSEEQVVLTRWGIHRSEIEGWKTTSDHTPWRRCFIAPEVWSRGEHTSQSEVYSLGMTLAYTLNPDAFDFTSEWTELVTYTTTKEEKLHQWIQIDGFPTAYKSIIEKATAHDKDDRYPSVFAFSQALHKLKPLYDYRGEFGEREALGLMEVVALILSKHKSHHRIWQAHLKEWVNWEDVDEIEQLVKAAINQQEAEIQKKAEEGALQDNELDRMPEENNAITPRSPRKSLVKKSALALRDNNQKTSKKSKHRRSPSLNPYLLKGSVAEEPGTIHTITFEGIPLQFCYVPQGDFFMGTHSHSPNVLRIERPQHVVTVSRPLLICQTPVTQGIYAAMMGINPSYFEDWHAPVEQVSWREAAEFCNHLSRLDGLAEVYEFKEESPALEEEEESLSEEDDLKARTAHLRTLRQGAYPSTKKEEADHKDSASENTLNEDQVEDSISTDDQSSNSQKDSSEDTDISSDEDVETLALSAEKEKDETLDEKRRQILNESEVELEEKAKKRYRLEKVKELPPTKVWVRCKLNCGGYRLPTEAEWEYAARASAATVFAGSNKWRDVAWGGAITQEGTQPVARLKSNDWGIYDMSGNVAEWCTDDQRAYTRNCVDPSLGSIDDWVLLDTRVIRGGGWRKPEIHSRVSARGRCLAVQRRNHIGFRIVRPLLPVSPFETGASSVRMNED